MNLFRSEMALLQCGRWTVTYHRDGDRDDPPASEKGWRVCNVEARGGSSELGPGPQPEL
jgi:hypothetical protein